MTALLLFLSIIIIIGALFAAPPALKYRSIKHFIIAAVLSTLGIILPVLTFVLSAVLVPEWQGEYQAGWLGSFHLGKLMLLPFVIWGISAFYYVQIIQGQNIKSTWVTGGLFAGLITSALCFIIGLFLIERHMDLIWFMIIPLYTCLWYAVLFWKNACSSLNWKSISIKTAISSIPFWIGSIMASQAYHRTLPDTPPDCFIVTAAGNGHPSIVGPFLSVIHRGKTRTVNEQLAVFWKLEEQWALKHPAVHAGFRKVYNRLGPLIAKQIRSPFMADLVYLCLKPVEKMALLLIRS